MDEKKRVKAFKRKYAIKTINSKVLCDVLLKQGYTIIRFNGVEEEEDVQALIDALDILEYVNSCKCFTYNDDKYRLVFINEGLNEEETEIVLAHEEGHILAGHLQIRNVIGNDIIQEYQANEFVHYLLLDKTGNKRKIKLFTVMLLLILIMSVGVGMLVKTRHDEVVYTEDFYRTETGSKYHVQNCMYIKDKIDVYRLTREEFGSGEYEPCGACMPDK